MKRRAWWLAVMLCLGFRGSAWAEENATFRLVLEGESVSETLLKATRGPTAKSLDEHAALGRSRHREVRAEQATLETELSKRGLERVTRTAVLVNSVTVHAPVSRQAELASLPGVKSVERVQQFKRSLVHSTPYVQAPAVWNGTPGYTGKGIRIGIIDSGIDYTHAAFGGAGTTTAYNNNNPTRIETGTFPTAKVAGGYDFAGDNYDASGAHGSTTPSPDPDPLDGPSGHGTHVAGIAASEGVLASGKTYTGPYGPNTYTNTFNVGPGVAPEATLYAIKIFGHQGTTGLVLEGLDWAADPNNDGSTGDHMHVVNLSLGSDFGEVNANGSEEVAIQRLTALGCVVAIAAGNGGNTPYIVSWPGTAPESICVANLFDDGGTFSSTKITAPAAVAGDYASVEANFTPKLAQVGPIPAPVVYTDPVDACTPLKNEAALKGKIALIDRGTCYFSDKVRSVQTAGAVGVIVVNNVTGAPIQMAGSGDTSDIKIPAVMISLTDGTLLKGQLDHGLAATLANSVAVAHPELADTIESSSSRGPTRQEGLLKPDIAAPGASIASVKGGSGTDAISYSGTSMATPHVAGAAALLRQAHPNWSAADIKAVLMNSAVPTHDQFGNRYAESRVGAGRLNVLAASLNGILLRDANAGEAISFSFGSYELLNKTTVHKTLTIANRLAPRTITLSVSNTITDPGFTILLSTNAVTLTTGGSANVDVALTIDPAALHRPGDPTSATVVGAYPVQPVPEASGGIYATDGVHTSHVPWHAMARALSSYTAAAKTIGVPPGKAVPMPIPTAGNAAHPAPLVGVFEFGATNASQQLAFPESATDILAVGAATDLQNVATFDDARVYFGLAMDGKWTTPERANISIDIEIDLNGDGSADYTLSNGSQGNLTGNDLEDASLSNAALASIAHAAGTTTTLVGGSPWNVLQPDVRDTAAYQNSSAILSAKARDLGLTSTLTHFRYRVASSGPNSASDTTSWIDFDLAHPVIDPTSAGIAGTPWFDEGRRVQALVHRANAPTGATSVKALLLHQHNPHSQQAEVISFRLNTADADNNGLPDWWELKYFGKLGNSVTEDSDGDGQTNAQEAAAGTDPTNPLSFFRIVSITPGTPVTKREIRWIGGAGYTYIIDRTTDLTLDFPTSFPGVTGQDGTNVFTDPNPPTAGTVFYRVRISGN